MEQSLESLDARLRKLEDIEEIRNLRMKYHLFINEGEFERIGEIYTDDAIVDLDYIDRAAGKENIVKMYLKIPNNTNLVKQYIHNHMVDVQGNTATGLSYLDARYTSNGESLIVSARFDEKYLRTALGWKISETIVKLFFSAPLSKGWAGPNLHNIQPFR